MLIVIQEKVKLGDVASIVSGLVVKRKQALNSGDGIKTYQMLTLKSFEPDGWLNSDELDLFESSEELENKYLTQIGDIIIRLSSPYTAITIDEKSSGLLIPSLFAIIRVESNSILSEYLGGYLNSSNIKKTYVKSAVGTAIQIIKTSMLKELEIPLQAIEKQRQIVEVNQLIVKERILLEKLINEKQKYYEAILNKLFDLK